MFESSRLFWQEFRRSFHTTGAILPSSSALARALTDPIDRFESPRRILEAGPGTGAVTRYLLPHLREGDRLTLCELNVSFANHLRHRFEADPSWKKYQHQVDIHVTDVREVLRPETFHMVVSGLPLNNFEASFVEQVLEGFLRSLLPGGIHTFFEYQHLRSIRKRLGDPTEKKRLQGVDDAVKAACKGTVCQRISVYRNVPPAWAYRLMKGKSTA